jgi:hypothetical protein
MRCPWRCTQFRGENGGITMENEYGLEKSLELELERQLAAAHLRIKEMVIEIDRRDELISDLQQRIAELEQQVRTTR